MNKLLHGNMGQRDDPNAGIHSMATHKYLSTSTTPFMNNESINFLKRTQDKRTNETIIDKRPSFLKNEGMPHHLSQTNSGLDLEPFNTQGQSEDQRIRFLSNRNHTMIRKFDSISTVLYNKNIQEVSQRNKNTSLI